MNGRICDPHLARFLQADPFVEDATTLNRYTYVHNNPLFYTDPSGYWSKYLPHNLTKRSGRSVMRAIGPTVSGVLITVGSYWCGPAYAACVAGGNYEMTRAFGGSQRDAFRGAAIAGVSAWAFGGGQAPDISQAGVMVAAQIAAAQHPAAGQALIFLYGNWGNTDPAAWLQDAAGRGMQYAAARELERRAERWGLTLGELNAILAVNSWVGKAIAGSTYDQRRGTVRGFFSREDMPKFGVIWDVNDTLLNIQGLPDAVTRQIMHDPNRPSHLTGPSLGAWRVNNLARMGYIESGALLSLPGLTYPATGTMGYCARRDLICGGLLMNTLRPRTESVGSRGLLSHNIDVVPGYRRRWPGP